MQFVEWERFAEMKVDPGQPPGIKTTLHKTNRGRAIKFSEKTLKQMGRVFLAAVLAVTVAVPMPAAPAARRASLHHISRFRGVQTFADSTLADIGTFDDPVVRVAAVEGLGRYNGAVVAVDPNTGRILTVVNQKIAFVAGYNLPEEHPGSFPMQPPAHGGIARMSSFGEGIHMTPLQLVSLAAAFANGGTLYYLQYPRTADDIQNFAPRVKRDLNIAEVLPEIREGMLAAVLYGTGKRSFDSGGDEMPLGKTGTCNDPTSRVGWFVTYADEAHPKIALAVLLRGSSRQVQGPTAAQVAGRIYRRLRQQNYFAASTAVRTLAAGVQTGN